MAIPLLRLPVAVQAAVAVSLVTTFMPVAAYSDCEESEPVVTVKILAAFDHRLVAAERDSAAVLDCSTPLPSVKSVMEHAP
jgi:hypothetical protein